MSCAVVSAHAASPVQNERSAQRDRYIMETCLKQDEEIQFLTAKVAALTKLDSQGKELIAALESQIAAQDKTIAALKAANEKGNQIDAASERELESFRTTVKSYEASLTDAKKEIARWQGKAQFWRRLAGFGITTAVIIGLAIGYTLGRK